MAAPVTRSRVGVARGVLGMLCVLTLGLGACSGDDDAPDETADEASFCRLAVQNAPVAEASAGVLRRMEELAPAEIEGDVGVLRDLAEQLEELDADDPDALALEFEVRFSAEHVAARSAVDDFVKRDCVPRETTSTTAGGADGAPSDASVGQDGGEDDES